MVGPFMLRYAVHFTVFQYQLAKCPVLQQTELETFQTFDKTEIAA